jgi:hypothetical protein
MACPMNPYRLNERLRIQKGIFLLAGSIEDTFAENLCSLKGYGEKKHILQLIIPRKIAIEGLKKLFQMNISRTTLFPGLDGYSKSLGIFHPCFSKDDMLWEAISRIISLQKSAQPAREADLVFARL